MKKLGIGCLVIIGIIVLAVVLAMLGTQGIVTATDELLTLIRDGKTADAYAATAKEFQAATSAEAFETFLEQSSIGDYASASWKSRSVENNTGSLEGTITTKSGGQIPVTVKLVKEGEAWKVLSIRKAEAGLIESEEAAPAKKEVPDQATLVKLTDTHMLLLGEAINKRDFSAFYQASAKLWQSQTSAKEMQAAFQQLIDRNMDLTTIRGQAPVFSDVPALDERGCLVLKGYYPVQPDAVHFELTFVYEYPAWKLIGLHL